MSRREAPDAKFYYSPKKPERRSKQAVSLAGPNSDPALFLMFDRLPTRISARLLSAGPRAPDQEYKKADPKLAENGQYGSNRAQRSLPELPVSGTGQFNHAARLIADGLAWGPPGQANVVEDVSVAVEPGQCLSIVGPNGAGKSTFLRLIYRFHRPRAGNILIDGQDIWSLDSRTVARRIAVVLQESPADFALTVKEVVELGRAPFRRGFASGGYADKQLVENVLGRMGIDHLSERRLATLSGGERQRVMVARALAQEPSLIVLDEPTNHLDIRHQLETLDFLKSLGITVICSLHDLNTALHFADRVLALSNGRALAFGRPEEILEPNLVAAAFSVNACCETLSRSGRSILTFHL